MKHFLILISLILCSSFAAQAQIQKGAVSIGGSITYNNQDNEQERTSPTGISIFETESDFLAIRPEAGIFVSQSLLLGLGIQYEYRYSRNMSTSNDVPGNPSSQKRNLVLVKPYMQKYYKLADNFYFSPSLSVFIGGGTGESNGFLDDRERDIFTLRANITPGLTYFISEKWGVTATFGEIFYNREREELEQGPNNPETREDIFEMYGLNFRFDTFNIGVQYFLRNSPR